MKSSKKKDMDRGTPGHSRHESYPDHGKHFQDDDSDDD